MTALKRRYGLARTTTFVKEAAERINFEARCDVDDDEHFETAVRFMAERCMNTEEAESVGLSQALTLAEATQAAALAISMGRRPGRP